MNTHTTHKRTIFATLALLLTVCAAQQQAYIIFRNPDVNADANVVTDISKIASPEMVNQIRQAVISSAENSAENVVGAANKAANNIVQNANANADVNANVQPNAANIAIRARQLQSGISGLGGLLALPLSLLSLPLSLLGGLTGGR